MDKLKDNIRDDEFRIIGKPSLSAHDGKSRRPKWLMTLLATAFIMLIGLTAVLLWKKKEVSSSEEGLFESTPKEIVDDKLLSSPIKPLGTETDACYTEKKDTVINDVVLSLYIPHNAVPELTLGVPTDSGNRIILAAQAADIRKDNKKILGAFVLKGKPLAWGLSKKGYCAIIDNKVTVGVSENSPLFEEATEKEGYFFRQYPLVDNGAIVENEPKNKTMRKALCARAGQVFVAVSETDESFHDFSQALVDLGVENAIYLVGGYSSFGWYIGSDGQRILFAPNVHRGIYMNENYIIWRQRTVL